MECKTCKGRGWVPDMGPMDFGKDCPTCNGTGRITDKSAPGKPEEGKWECGKCGEMGVVFDEIFQEKLKEPMKTDEGPAGHFIRSMYETFIYKYSEETERLKEDKDKQKEMIDNLSKLVVEKDKEIESLKKENLTLLEERDHWVSMFQGCEKERDELKAELEGVYAERDHYRVALNKKD